LKLNSFVVGFGNTPNDKASDDVSILFETGFDTANGIAGYKHAGNLIVRLRVTLSPQLLIDFEDTTALTANDG
jgi:hypothetical protein